MPVPVPIDDVRLVVPLEDPQSGNVKDVIVKHLYASGPFLEQEYGSPTPKHTRYITGLDTEIPWPETDPSEERDEDIDTLRIDVEARTYQPSLIEQPFPATVIDELRNKFSKYRQRHDPEWVEEKQKEDYYQEWQKSRRLLNPKTELLEQQRGQKQKEREAMVNENGEPVISQETTSFIEQFMARQGQKNANA
jgi:large subunit ribosomal protein L24